MGKRGRPSAASMMIASTAPLETVERLTVPFDLTDEEAEIWVAVVSIFPADWFTPATAPMLAQYCRHSIQARRLGKLIEMATADKELSVKNYERLLKMQARESAIMASLATKMRISQQATSNHRGNAAPISKKPWEA